MDEEHQRNIAQTKEAEHGQFDDARRQEEAERRDSGPRFVLILIYYSSVDISIWGFRKLCK